jgi:hypothetical protein
MRARSNIPNFSHGGANINRLLKTLTAERQRHPKASPLDAKQNCTPIAESFTLTGSMMEDKVTLAFCSRPPQVVPPTGVWLGLKKIQNLHGKGINMRGRVWAMAGTVALALGMSMQAMAEGPQHKGTVVVPATSVEMPGDAGKREHTNIQMWVPADGFKSAQPLAAGPPYSGYLYETPASVSCLYRLTTAVKGCNPNTVTANPTGGSKAIALVDAYDDANAASDIVFFAKQFGLPTPNFEVVFASGTRPPSNSGWELEDALDIEWSFSMAPKAKIYLVEAASDSNSDLFAAVLKASALVSAAGGGEVSMSWGGSEYTGENANDSHFTTGNVVYFASAGDGPGVLYPSASPNVVSVGGTTLRRDPETGDFIKEVSWDSTGGGVSEFEARPSYQAAIASKVGSYRGTPDMAAVADPNTGVWVYDSGNGGWWVVGGTSVASPTLAGIVNAASSFAASTNAELTTVYENAASESSHVNDILGDYCGPYMGYTPGKGWDLCTGVGSPKGYSGK